jgi:hypothetical protein
MLRSAPSGPRRRRDEVQEHLLAFAAHDGVDPGRFLQHLRVHEGAVDAAQHGDDGRVHFLGHLQQPLGLVDGRRDGGAADDVGLDLGDALAHLVVAQVVRHRVDEGARRCSRRPSGSRSGRPPRPGGQLPAISAPPEW